MQLIRSDAIIGSPTSQCKSSALQCIVRTSTDGTRSGGAQAERDTYLYRSPGETGANHTPRNKTLLSFAFKKKVLA